MEVNKIYNEDCMKTIGRMPINFMQSIITSPPYYNLRDYEHKNQLGQESSVEDYINALVSVFEEAKPKLKKDGIVFVNLGDSYSNKCLLCVPDRFKVAMIDKGWYCRNDIIWHKPNAMPSSVKDRFVVDYERVLMFTKNKKYKFNTQYEERKTKKTSSSSSNGIGKYKNLEQEASVRQGMNKARGTKLIEKRYNLPKQKRFVDFIRSRVSLNTLSSEIITISKSKMAHWFRYDEAGFSFPSAKDWNVVKYLIDDWSEEFNTLDKMLNDITLELDDINKNSHKGRIKRSVWSINTKPSKLKHFAPYPTSLIEPLVLSSTNEEDIIYDPFIGSGTTAIISKKLKRKYLGSELNQEYFNISINRLCE
jgi:site-specific DNA-methyltransferase (adenine-specific)